MQKILYISGLLSIVMVCSAMDDNQLALYEQLNYKNDFDRSSFGFVQAMLNINPKKALGVLDDLDKKNFPPAQHLLGDILKRGCYGVEKNEQKALGYYEAAAKKDYPKAQLALALYYLQRAVAPEQGEQLVNSFYNEKPAQKVLNSWENDAIDAKKYSQILLDTLLFEVKDVNVEKDMIAYKEPIVIEEMYQDAGKETGIDLYNKGKYKEAFEYFQDSKKDQNIAYYYLARMCFNGQGQEKSFVKALYYCGEFFGYIFEHQQQFACANDNNDNFDEILTIVAAIAEDNTCPKEVTIEAQYHMGIGYLKRYLCTDNNQYINKGCLWLLKAEENYLKSTYYNNYNNLDAETYFIELSKNVLEKSGSGELAYTLGKICLKRFYVRKSIK